ncbi:AAA family ATPase [Micromonospora sp. NPDC000207]|uniref:AAA family ATPase n=1 Tax=Micromonospora sp. NPDC000207 TaxID=3154246 RepID=UPI00331B2FAB
MDAHAPDPTGAVNPYPSSAVAQIADAGSSVVTIPTVAIQQATAVMDDYLAALRTAPRTPAGRVLAVVGEHGTGKTHLASHLIRHATDHLGGDLQWLHLNAPPDTFVSLYRALADKLTDRRDVVERQVRRLYADILAVEVSRSRVTAPLAESLLDGTLDPVAVVDTFNMMESRLLGQLRDRLREVTDNSEFARALTLLLRGGFENPVWDWIAGRPPAEVLRERGITSTLTATETSALQAMGVFALLIGYGPRPFVLVVDELDQLLTAAGRERDEALDAFKELLRVFAASNTFLIIAGLPDLLETLPRDVRARTGEQVVMTPLTVAEARAYVLRRQGNRLAPFTEETVTQVVELAHGVPRRVISLCHRLWGRSRDQGTEVTATMVREAARDLYGGLRGNNLPAEIRQVLVGSGLDSYVPDYPLTESPDSRIDYWIPAGRDDAGCGILLVGPLLDEGDAAAVVTRAQTAHAHRDCELLLVVVEPVPEQFRARVREAVGREPLVYRQRSFADQLTAELKAMVGRLEERYPQQGPLVPVAPHLARLDRRQSATQHMVGLLTSALHELRVHNAQQFTALHRELHGLRPSTAGTPGSGTGPPFTGLPDPVLTLLDRALTAADLHAPVGALLGRMFDDDEAGRTARQAVRVRIRNSQVHSAAGVAALLTELVEAFGRAVSGWYDEVRRTGRPTVEQWERLEEICQIFDVVHEYLPAYQLRTLTDLTGGPERPEADGALGDLSSRVRDELRSALAAGAR